MRSKRYELERELISNQLEMYADQIMYVKKHVQHNDEDLKHQLNAIRQKKSDTQAEIDRLRDEQKSIENEWLRVQRALYEALPENTHAIAEAYVMARSEWRKTYQVVLELKERALQLLDLQTQAWQRRYALVKGEVTPDQLNDLKKDVEKQRNSMSQTLQIQQSILVSLQKQLGSIEGRLADTNTPEPVREHLATQIKALRKQVDRRLEYQSVILALEQVEKRLYNEITSLLGQLTIKEHLTDIKDDIVDFWNIEIWTVDGQPVTLKKVAVTIVILIVGMIVAKYMLAVIRDRFFNQIPIQGNDRFGCPQNFVLLRISSSLPACLANGQYSIDSVCIFRRCRGHRGWIRGPEFDQQFHFRFHDSRGAPH